VDGRCGYCKTHRHILASFDLAHWSRRNFSSACNVADLERSHDRSTTSRQARCKLQISSPYGNLGSLLSLVQRGFEPVSVVTIVEVP